MLAALHKCRGTGKRNFIAGKRLFEGLSHFYNSSPRSVPNAAPRPDGLQVSYAPEPLDFWRLPGLGWGAALFMRRALAPYFLLHRQPQPLVTRRNAA